MSIFDILDKQIGDFFETLPETKTRKPRPVKKDSVRQVTFTILESYPIGKIFSSGDEMTRTGLKYEVANYLWMEFGINAFPHIDTCLRYLREYNEPVQKIICKNSGKSLYEVIR